MQILTIDALSQMLKLHPRIVRKLLRERVIPGKKIARRWYVSEDSLRESFRVTENRRTRRKGKRD